MLQSATPAPSAAGVPDVLPVVMPDVPVVPEMLPAPRPELTLPALLPADLPAEGRAVLAAALAGPVPGPRRERGDLLHAGTGMCWDEEECARLLGFLDQVDDTRDRRGRLYPLRYLLALPLVAGMAGDDETDAAAEWAASAPDDLLVRLGAPRDRSGRPRRPDAVTLGRILGDVDQVAYDDALCGWAAARARAQRPGMRRHLRIDGKALHGARRGGRTPMLLSGVWDDGTTAAQLPVDKKTNEIPVLRELVKKIPDGELAGAVITADQMHTQRKHAGLLHRKNAYWVLTVEHASHCSCCWSWRVKESSLAVSGLDTEPFAASAGEVDGVELAALDLVQHGLAGDAEAGGGLAEGQPAVGCLGPDPVAEFLVDADLPGCSGGELLAGDEAVA